MRPQLFYLACTLASLTACSADTRPTTQPSNSKDRAEHLRDGSDDTDMFLRRYEGKFVDSENDEAIAVSADGRVVRLQVRNAGGGEDSKVPDQTICSYIQTGRILAVEKRSAADRERHLDFATHRITVQYNAIKLTNELEPTTLANSNCQLFLKEQKAEAAARDGVQFSYEAELLSDSSFRIHSSGGGDYKIGGPRTPSTLDEVYTKVEQSATSQTIVPQDYGSAK